MCKFKDKDAVMQTEEILKECKRRFKDGDIVKGVNGVIVTIDWHLIKTEYNDFYDTFHVWLRNEEYKMAILCDGDASFGEVIKRSEYRHLDDLKKEIKALRLELARIRKEDVELKPKRPENRGGMFL